ncbi:hypothetical protein GGR57DRAFT_99184 [Xylariaceae sp. FL1272]|nr:hypothetical protein GGR57DRAFT_99184 [Xylariaceae sp. FL1272]
MWFFLRWTSNHIHIIQVQSLASNEARFAVRLRRGPDECASAERKRISFHHESKVATRTFCRTVIIIVTMSDSGRESLEVNTGHHSNNADSLGTQQHVTNGFHPSSISAAVSIGNTEITTLDFLHFHLSRTPSIRAVDDDPRVLGDTPMVTPTPSSDEETGQLYDLERELLRGRTLHQDQMQHGRSRSLPYMFERFMLDNQGNQLLAYGRRTKQSPRYRVRWYRRRARRALSTIELLLQSTHKIRDDGDEQGTGAGGERQ